jgi:hypothetical protein
MFDAVLAKPVDLDVLITTIERLGKTKRER